MAYGSNNKWVEVSRTIAGKEYWNRDSLIKKEKGVIEISTKYLKIDSKNKRLGNGNQLYKS